MKEVAQVFGLIGMIIFATSVQFKNKDKIVLLQLFANIFYAFQYLCLGTYTAALMDFITFIRSLLYYYFDINKKKIPITYPIIFIIISLIVGFIFYNSPLSIIPIIITILYIISLAQNNLKFIRITFIMCALGWLYFNYQVGAYVCMIGNIFELISGTISLIRCKKS